MSMNKEDAIRPAAPALDAVSESGSKGSKSPSELSRGGWGSPVEFVLACLGYAVGLGNVWRFPYLCYRNGGGAFLIPYFLMLVFIGLPLFYLELYVGQYTAVGPIEVFSRIAPAFSGLGYANLVVITLIIIYYMIIVAWTLFYTFMSFNPVLGWGECFNDYNSDNCYSGQYEDQCRNISFTGASTDMTWWNRTCVTVSSICERENLQPFNGTDCVSPANGTFIKWNTLIERTLASEEYYNGFVLGRQPDTTWENYGAMQWHLVGCLFLAWFVAFLCVIKGVQSAGKVVYFTALFPYVMLTALVIRGVTLEGAVDGILFYIKPDWDQLANAGVWGDAASQIFYSFGVGCGSLITLASYNKFTNNCHFDATFVSITNFLTSIYAGFAIFSVLGFQAQRMGVSVNDVAKDGPGLAFVAYPEAILQMPLPQLWAILFFFMLFILGLGSQFAGIEAVNTAFIDHYPQFRNQKWKVTLATCSICFVLGLPMCFSGGVYLFSLMDWNTASWAILIIGLTECIVVSWCYGANRALDDLRTMSMKLGKVIRNFWWLNWTVLTPAFCVAVFIFIMIEWSPASYEDYVFPPWADALGWMMGLSTLAPIIIGFIYIYFVEKVRGKDLITPTELWGPAESSNSVETEIVKPTPYSMVEEGEMNPGFVASE